LTLIRWIIFIATFAALAVAFTLASCYFFPEVPKAWIAKDPWYEVRHAWQDRSTMLAFPPLPHHIAAVRAPAVGRPA
jgi:hypothetical protein